MNIVGRGSTGNEGRRWDLTPRDAWIVRGPRTLCYASAAQSWRRHRFQRFVGPSTVSTSVSGYGRQQTKARLTMAVAAPSAHPSAGRSRSPRPGWSIRWSSPQAC